MPKYLVETVSMFRMRYVVDCESADHAMDEVTMEAVEEFGQHHVAENTIGCREVNDDEVVRLFFEDAPYLREWGPERAFKNIHKIEY